METASDGDRCREVVQPDQRLWVHSAARRWQGRFRPYFGGREGRSVDPQRGSAGPVRRGCKQGEDLGGEPQGEVNRMWGAPRIPPWGWIVSSWVYCEKCLHHAPMALVPLIIRWVAESSSDR